MATLNVIGSASRLRDIFQRWPDIDVRGGHTSIAFAPGSQMARDIYAALVTEYSFTPLNTTVPDAPVKAPRELPVTVKPETEYTFIPQFAGG